MKLKILNHPILSGARAQLGRLCTDEAGQSTTEYILILAVVVMIAVKFKGLFSSKLTTMMGTLGKDLDDGIQQADAQ